MDISTEKPSTISDLTNDLQNINLDVKTGSSSVTITFENDNPSKDMTDSSQNLSKYFNQSNKPPVDSVNFFNEVQTNSQDKKSTKAEPVVCRIFAEAPPQQKADPTTSFFDFIGNKSTINSSGIVTDLGLSTKDSPDVCIYL